MGILGIREYIIIICFVLIGLLGWMIKSQANTIDEQKLAIHDLQVNVDTLKGSIQTQNEAIEKLGVEKSALDVLVDVLQKKQTETKVEYQVIKEKVYLQPKATTCDGAILELKSTNENLAKKWNKR